jgi:hypothetical protein
MTVSGAGVASLASSVDASVVAAGAVESLEHPSITTALAASAALASTISKVFIALSYGERAIRARESRT